MDFAALTALRDRARADLPGWLSLELADATAPQPPLFPEEEAAVGRAVASRRAEFKAGRAAARAALAARGGPACAIPAGPDRAPVWPAGYCASITHTGSLCLAAAARLSDAQGVGLDLEVLQILEPGVLERVSTETERAGLPADPDHAGARIFSAKEAAYKAQYPLSRTLFGFDGLRFDAEGDGRARLGFTRDIAPFAKGDVLTVRQWQHAGLVLSVCLLPPGED
ncbi:4'-phosphopantetheinyl transferase family protein [Thalassococcus sp. BH17M4-6]|uniref:4'-phosphopantetheinyl transferase family protein n=1 Tax=Thalassococcus sp. BH17M4-6 TaxID=3413148 RepID=UPI003BDAC530